MTCECPRTVALVIGAATHFRSRNLSEVQRSVTGQKGFVFFCLFLLGGREREMSKNLGESGIRQSSGAFVLKKPFAETGPWGVFLFVHQAKIFNLDIPPVCLPG